MVRLSFSEVLRTLPEIVPSAASRYLLPDERQIIAIRQHPIVLTLSSCPLVANVTAFAMSAADVIPRDPLVLGLLGIAFPGSCYLLYSKWRAWLRAYVVITHARIMLINLPWKKPLVSIPLTEAFDMTLACSLIPGRVVGCGSFFIKKPGLGGRTRKIRYLPYPEQLFLEVSGLLYPDDDPLRERSSRNFLDS